jgi:hypothetical protein
MSRGGRVLLAVCAAAAVSPVVTPDASAAWDRLVRNDLNVEAEGQVLGLPWDSNFLNLFTRSGKMRAVERDGGQHAWHAMLRYQYLGGLGLQGAVDRHNGFVWRQIGLKLHAANTCNVLYVMWQEEPEPHIGAAVKRNPGQSRDSQCRTRGYVSIARIPMPRDHRTGSVHTLEVKTENDTRGPLMTIHANGKQVWSGIVPGVHGLEGPMGVRSDAGRFRFALSAQDRRPYGPHRVSCVDC